MGFLLYNCNNFININTYYINSNFKKMKTNLLKILGLFLLISFNGQSQTADEILENYFKNIGGKEKLSKLTGLKMIGEVNSQGMKIPVEIAQLNGGKMYVKINLMGQEMTQMAFDGETGWGLNFTTMKPEKMDQETADIMKYEILDFPDPFLNYKEKGYRVENLGKETKEGTTCYKIKLTKKSQIVDGEKVENIVFYYFDAENFVPIMTESEIKQGPMKGQMSISTMSDYQEVEGLYLPFSMNEGGQPITFTKIELNPSVDPSVFQYKGE